MKTPKHTPLCSCFVDKRTSELTYCLIHRAAPAMYEEKTMRYLSHNLWVISDKTAGALTRATPKPTLPKPGYEKLVILNDGRKARLKRTTLTMLDPIKRTRGWVWTVFPL